jgi:hypothetical protein
MIINISDMYVIKMFLHMSVSIHKKGAEIAFKSSHLMSESTASCSAAFTYMYVWCEILKYRAEN